MMVRRYHESDLGAILDLHRRQGLDYALPELNRMAIGCVIEEGHNITHAVFLRNITEAYWLYDREREWKRQTLARLLVLHKEVEIAAGREDIEEVQAFIPPEAMSPKMHKTMLKLGWEKPLWTCYRHSVAPELVEA